MKKIINSFWIGVGIAIIAYVIYKIVRNSFTDHLMGVDLLPLNRQEVKEI
jgi:multisubunit Na+/H+ antiporter MnhF subunit